MIYLFDFILCSFYLQRPGIQRKVKDKVRIRTNLIISKENKVDRVVVENSVENKKVNVVVLQAIVIQGENYINCSSKNL